MISIFIGLAHQQSTLSQTTYTDFFNTQLPNPLFCNPKIVNNTPTFQIEFLNFNQQKLKGNYPKTSILGCSCQASQLVMSGTTPTFRSVGKVQDSPCPGIMINKTTNAHVKFINNIQVNCNNCPDNLKYPRTTIHFHGLQVSQTSDGYPTAFYNKKGQQGPAYMSPLSTNKNQYVHQINGNQGHTFSFYHDHMMDETRLHISQGLFGLFLIDYFANIQSFKLPKLEFTKVMLIQDLIFSTDGQVFQNFPQYDGNFMFVNGIAFPKISVVKTTYRLSILNACVDRTLILKFKQSNGNFLSFNIIGFGQGIGQTQSAVQAFIMPAQRVEILIDFNAAVTSSITMVNVATHPFTLGPMPVQPQIARFQIGGQAVASLVYQPAVDYQYIEAIKDQKVSKVFQVVTVNLPNFTIFLNGQNFMQQFSVENLQEGQVIEFVFVNTNFLPHQIHPHLFQIVPYKVCKLNSVAYIAELQRLNGPMSTAPYKKPLIHPKIQRYQENCVIQNAKALNDMQHVLPFQVAHFKTKFESRSGNYLNVNGGRYVIHCHMLTHQDERMMIYFVANKSRLNLGAIIGGTVGGVMLLIIIIAVIVCLYKRKQLITQQNQTKVQGITGTVIQ